MSIPPFEIDPPKADHVTPYDERHFVTYIRLLDAATEKADWKEAVSIMFGINVEVEPTRAKAVHHNHLARAQWMTTTGYKDLLAKAREQR